MVNTNQSTKVLSFQDVPKDIGSPLLSYVKSLIKSFPLIVIIGEDQKIHWVSEGGEELLGYKDNALLGRDLEIILSNSERDGHLSRVTKGINRVWNKYKNPSHVEPIGMAADRDLLQARKKNGNLLSVQITLAIGFNETQESIIDANRPRSYVVGFFSFTGEEVDRRSQAWIFLGYKNDIYNTDGTLIKKESTDLAIGLTGQLCRDSEIDIWLDKYKIRAAEDWKEEIKNGLETSSAAVFLISDASIESEECVFEYEYAIELGIPIIPVLNNGNNIPVKFYKERPIDPKTGEPAKKGYVPKGIQKIQLISKYSSVRELSQIIIDIVDPQIKHARYYGDLLKLTERWENSNKSDKLLLRGLDLDNALAWQALNQTPLPNKRQKRFLTQSVTAKRRLQIKRAGIVLFVIVSTLASLFAVRRRFYTPALISSRCILASTTDKSIQYSRQDCLNLDAILSRKKRKAQRLNLGFRATGISYFEYRRSLIVQVASTEKPTTQNVGAIDDNDLIHNQLAREVPPERIIETHKKVSCYPTREESKGRLVLSCPVYRRQILSGNARRVLAGFVIITYEGPINDASLIDAPQNFTWNAAFQVEHELHEASERARNEENKKNEDVFRQ